MMTVLYGLHVVSVLFYSIVNWTAAPTYRLWTSMDCDSFRASHRCLQVPLFPY